MTIIINIGNALPVADFLEYCGELTAMNISAESAAVLCEIASKVVSFVGHDMVAERFSEILGIELPTNRAKYSPVKGEKYLAGLVQMPKDLPRGTRLTEAELNQLPLKWVLIEF